MSLMEEFNEPSIYISNVKPTKNETKSQLKQRIRNVFKVWGNINTIKLITCVDIANSNGTMCYKCIIYFNHWNVDRDNIRTIRRNLLEGTSVNIFSNTVEYSSGIWECRAYSASEFYYVNENNSKNTNKKNDPSLLYKTVLTGGDTTNQIFEELPPTSEMRTSFGCPPKLVRQDAEDGGNWGTGTGEGVPDNSKNT
jgi:hypothetical protein